MCFLIISMKMWFFFWNMKTYVFLFTFMIVEIRNMKIFTCLARSCYFNLEIWKYTYFTAHLWLFLQKYERRRIFRYISEFLIRKYENILIFWYISGFLIKKHENVLIFPRLFDVLIQKYENIFIFLHILVF